MDVNAFGITHVGKQRQHNEDSFLVAAEAKLYLVADGMGGHAAGEIASRIAVDSISEFILHTKEDDGTWPHAYDEQYRRSTNRLMTAVRLANTRVLEAMRWGFPPPAKSRVPVTNVRNLASPFWRSALNRPDRRCLVPVTDFCEWEGEAVAPQTLQVRARILWPALGFPAVIAPRKDGSTEPLAGNPSRCICALILSD